MAPKNEEKTTFTINKDIFYYKIMFVSLKNAIAINQRLMNKVFKERIKRNIEVYVDEMLVKSQAAEDHIANHEETFSMLRCFQRKLNLNKCILGVTSSTFLDFMVLQ